MEFNGGNAHLFIVLPNANDGLTKVLGEMREDKLMELVKHSRETRVEVILPKFKIESTHNLEDEELLPSLGIKSAFSKSADFSGISNIPMFIGRVLQKAMISVDENGCEAAAASLVEFLPIAPRPPPSPPPLFRADHPFAFFLIKSQQKVLFNGAFMGKN